MNLRQKEHRKYSLTTKVKNLSINGKNICITGTLSMSRKKIINKLYELGAGVHASIFYNTDILLVGKMRNDTIKYKNAVKQGITIMTEKELSMLSKQGNK